MRVKRVLGKERTMELTNGCQQVHKCGGGMRNNKGKDEGFCMS